MAKLVEGLHPHPPIATAAIHTNLIKTVAFLSILYEILCKTVFI